MARPGGFRIDEDALREIVLEAYHARRGEPGRPKRVLDAVRQLLSGAPGSGTVLERYWFEVDPPASIASFIEDLEKASVGLAAEILDPLIGAVERMEKKTQANIAPNIGVFVSSLAGAVAVKTGIDETLASGAVAAALIGLSRVGRRPFEEALGRKEKP